jgi:hypothetical protein
MVYMIFVETCKQGFVLHSIDSDLHHSKFLTSHAYVSKTPSILLYIMLVSLVLN